MEETKDKLLQLIRETGELPPDFVIDSQTKLSELGVNSISFIKVIVQVEGAFGIEFDDDDLDYKKFESVGDLVAAIECKCSKES